MIKQKPGRGNESRSKTDWPWTLFDPAAKMERHETVFPEECKKAFEMGAALAGKENWSLYLLSSDPEFERCFGRSADKKRKLYNGMIKCDLFMYY